MAKKAEKAQHTPGPWTFGPAVSTHNSPNRFWESTVTSYSGIVATACGAYDIEAEANARLMAAAPELLAALEGAYLVLLQMPDSTLRMRSQRELCHARDAICAATGREPQDVQESFEEAALLVGLGNISAEDAIRKARGQ